MKSELKIYFGVIAFERPLQVMLIKGQLVKKQGRSCKDYIYKILIKA